jgi:hypothetical protein
MHRKNLTLTAAVFLSLILVLSACLPALADGIFVRLQNRTNETVYFQAEFIDSDGNRHSGFQPYSIDPGQTRRFEGPNWGDTMRIRFNGVTYKAPGAWDRSAEGATYVFKYDQDNVVLVRAN